MSKEQMCIYVMVRMPTPQEKEQESLFFLSRSFPFASSSLFHFIYQPTDDVTFVGIKKTTHLTLALS
jgi:hypothetical protein